MADVTLVIPGRNCAATVDACLGAVAPRLEDHLATIVFVDDGSTDDTRERAGRYPVTILDGGGRGPGAARNLGWRHATSELIWFVDSDCVAAPNALEKLLRHFDEPAVAAVSGTYGNARAHSLLACLVHEEIVARHATMGEEVDFLATFNVLYRRQVLDELGGFDERYLKAQDAELSFRVREAGHKLHFEGSSVVDHHHEDRLFPYLRTQRQQGYWRVWLHIEHPGRAGHNSYSNALDHLQPVVAMGVLASLPALAFPFVRWLPIGLAVVLLLMQAPMTATLVRRRGARYTAFAAMSAVRAVWRGVGMTCGVLRYALSSRTSGGSSRHISTKA